MPDISLYLLAHGRYTDQLVAIAFRDLRNIHLMLFKLSVHWPLSTAELTILVLLALHEASL